MPTLSSVDGNGVAIVIFAVKAMAVRIDTFMVVSDFMMLMWGIRLQEILGELCYSREKG
jgi:hypothetical protein